MGSDPTYVIPTKDLVDRALARLGKLQHRRVFYSKLDNPNWVKALDEAHAFDNPPALVNPPDGSVRAEPWPEIDYLARMAASVPGDVAKVFAKVITTEHPWIRRAIVDGASEMPASEAVALADGITAWAEGPYSRYLDWTKLARLIVNLLNGNRSQHGKGMKLAAAFYGPQAPKEDRRFGLSKPYVPVEHYAFDQTLPDIAAAMGDSAIGTLRRWLEAFQVNSGAFTEGSNYDLSVMWRPAIRVRGGRHNHDYEDTLVDAVRDAAVRSIKAKASLATTKLLESKHALLHRIALDALAQVLEDLSQSGQELPADLASAAEAYLAYDGHAEESLRVEYIELVKACGLFPGKVALSALIGIVEAGQKFTDDEYVASERKYRPDEDEAVFRQEAAELRERWRHRLLAQVGTELLPSELSTRLAELDSKFGVIDNPEPRNPEIISSFVRSSDPQTLGLHEDTSDSELVDYANAWIPSPEPWDRSDDMGWALAAFIAEHPDRFTGGVDQLRRLKYVYVRSVVSGWAKAVRDGKDIPWGSALEACQHVLDGDVASSDDRNAGVEVVEVGRLWLEAVEKHPPTGDAPLPPELLPHISDMLVGISATREEGEVDESDSMDYLTRSLNRARPIASRALIRLLAWDSQQNVHDRVIAQLDALLAETPQDRVIAAALGEGFGWLYNHAEQWLRDNGSRIFGDENRLTAFQEIALSTALATQHIHPKLLEIVRPGMLGVLNSKADPPLVIGWKDNRTFDQLIGDWVVGAVIRDWLDLNDDLVAAFYNKVTPAVRGEVIGHVAWSMSQATDVAPTIIERTKRLWDARAEHVSAHPEDAAEVGEFYWFALCKDFEIEWWLPRLIAAATAYNEFDPKSLIGEKLAEAAEVDSDLALAALEKLLERRDPDKPWDGYYLTHEAAPGVIAAALDADDPGLQKRARSLMNKLGDEGEIDLKHKVESRRKGSHRLAEPLT
jgi:hypothetical protein